MKWRGGEMGGGRGRRRRGEEGKRKGMKGRRKEMKGRRKGMKERGGEERREKRRGMKYYLH